MGWLETLIPSVSGMATVAFAVWKWSQERAQDRRKERAKLAALYVNPFLSACEDLQSRLYNILEKGGLAVLRERYPDKAYAEETLYLIVRYFGWEGVVYRYGPYTQNREVIRLVEGIRDAFATSDFARGAFCFFRPQQKALGQLVMERRDGDLGVEFDVISVYEFKNRLTSLPFCEMESVKQTLAALRDATAADTLPGRDRLAMVQNHLVGLLSYLEGREGFSLFPRERKTARLPAGAVQP